MGDSIEKKDGGLPAKVPRNLEALVKHAALDPEFRVELVKKRSGLANELKIPLDENEKAMLDGIPEKQLRKIIEKTRVPADQRSILSCAAYSGLAGVAILALIAYLTASASSISDTFGSITTTLGCVSDMPVSVKSESPQFFGMPFSTGHFAWNKPIQLDIKGMSVMEAIAALEHASGLKISLVKSFPEQDPSTKIDKSTASFSFGQTLDAICVTLVNKKAIFTNLQIVEKDKEIKIQFYR